MDITAELHARLEHPARTGGALAGVEHEFTVSDEAGPTDFRALIPNLDLGRRLDPGDPLAVRGRWGGVITADGREAEIATPPVVVRPGFTDELAAWAATGTRRLRAAVPDLHLAGYSTHLSVEVDDRQVVRVARRFTTRFALAQMLLVDGPDSPGLLVRPRRGRLELCGEYVTGSQLRAASVFAVAATAASRCRPKAPNRLPPAIEAARGRYGYYVDRCAFGPDLYRHGRATLLRKGRTAQDVLASSWEAVRPSAEIAVSPSEVRLVDDVVDGRAPLPLEFATTEDGDERNGADAATGRIVDVRRRAGMTVEPIVATWTGTAFRVTAGGDAAAVVTIPLRLLDAFLDALDAGQLDDVLRAAMAAAPTRPRLVAADQLERVGTYGGVGALAGLVPGERDPLTGRLAGAGRGGRGSRENKDRHHESPKGRPPATKIAVLAAAAVAVVALLVALASALGRDDPDAVLVAGPGPESTTTTTSTAEAAVAVPAEGIPPEVWRGWVASDSDDEFEGEGGGSRYYSRAWWVDGSPTSLAVEWSQDSHHVSGLSGCQQGEVVGRATGRGESQVVASPTLRDGYSEFDDGPGYLFYGYALDGDILLDGIVRYCDGTTQEGDAGGLSTFLNGFNIGAPTPLDDVPETLSHRQTIRIVQAANETRTVQVCMTRSTVDTDADGLPDDVDLAPSVAAPLVDLGRPGGPGGTVIPSRVPGGVEGTEGVPGCPAAATPIGSGPGSS
ncbi:MAG TPA: hypothetical protein VM933_08965 [Acidimicrobiales bacterium]|nr:hypothetical protein [Acidimicrobiales bacterium]